MKRIWGFFGVCLLAGIAASASFARDAAFLNPGAGGIVGMSDEAVRVDPKSEIDVGDTALNVAKRTSVFFVNQTNMPVKIEKVTINGDSSVLAEATANDCVKQGTIAALSRCSVEVSATPTGAGPWNVDLLMTHNGAGRITRARISGKTVGASGSEKAMGLAVSSKEVKPIDFGTIDVGSGKIVRSTLMVNDSSEPITVYSIDVIEADNGLQRLEQGCAIDMELAPGASCPVTLLWVPKGSGPISTDLIIRHSGKMGFAVIPVRGAAKGAGGSASTAAAGDGKKEVVPMPPSATDLEKAVSGAVAPLPESAFGGNYMGGSRGNNTGGGDGGMHLIGTIGDRAIILLPNGETITQSTGSEFDVGGRDAKVIAVNSRSAELAVDGKKKTLNLEASASLVSRAVEQAKQEAVQQQAVNVKSGASGTKR